ncbi:uncharacterized protein LOC144584247 [Pogona vitticeps]
MRELESKICGFPCSAILADSLLDAADIVQGAVVARDVPSESDSPLDDDSSTGSEDSVEALLKSVVKRLEEIYGKSPSSMESSEAGEKQEHVERPEGPPIQRRDSPSPPPERSSLSPQLVPRSPLPRESSSPPAKSSSISSEHGKGGSSWSSPALSLSPATRSPFQVREIESEAEEFLKELDERWPYLDADR